MNRSNFLKTLALACVFVGSIPLLSQASEYESGLVHYAQGDYQAALLSFQIAAEQAEPGAAHILATMYQSGKGGVKNPVKAFQGAMVAAFRGLAQAQ